MQILEFRNANIEIQQITKPFKQLKTAKNFQHKSNVFVLKFIFRDPKITLSNKLGIASDRS